MIIIRKEVPEDVGEVLARDKIIDVNANYLFQLYA